MCFDIHDHRFWVNVVGYLDAKGKRRHTGNVSRSVIIEPMPFVSDFALAESDE